MHPRTKTPEAACTAGLQPAAGSACYPATLHQYRPSEEPAGIGRFFAFWGGRRRAATEPRTPVWTPTRVERERGTDQGYVPRGGRGWVDQIRQIGNEATHEIDFKTADEAERLLGFLEMLLKFIYEFPARAPTP
jgi:hypothetical protein